MNAALIAALAATAASIAVVIGATRSNARKKEARPANGGDTAYAYDSSSSTLSSGSGDDMCDASDSGDSGGDGGGDCGGDGGGGD